MREALSEAVVGSSFSVRLANANPRRSRLSNQLMLGSYVLPQEWDGPSMETIANSLEAAREIINCWSPFNKRKFSIANMCNL